MNSSRLQFYGLREFIQTHMGKLIAKEVVIPLKKKQKPKNKQTKKLDPGVKLAVSQWVFY